MTRVKGCGFLIDRLPAEVFTKERFSHEQREMARTAGSARRFASGTSSTRISMASS
jgi:hypothetical protein